jgi:hypothetical protein
MHYKAFLGFALIAAVAAGFLLPTGHAAKAEKTSNIPTLELAAR